MTKQIATEPVSLFKLFWRMGGWITLIFLGIFGIMTLISLSAYHTAARFAAEGLETTAEVTDRYYRESRDSDGDRTVTYYLVLDYTTLAGQAMNVHRTVGSSLYNKTQVGMTMPVWYLASEPDELELSQGENHSGAIIAQVIGLIFAAGFLGGLWYWGGKAVAATRARRFGARERVVVTGVEPSNVTVNKTRLYRVHWREASGRMGKSMVFRPEVLAQIGRGTEITVYQGIKRAWWEGDVGPRAPEYEAQQAQS